MKRGWRYARGVVLTISLMGLLWGCAAMQGPYTTARDKTAKGAGIGAAVGALVAVLDGRDEADDILARAAIGAVVGGGVGAYMDAQEEKIARIPGTTVERVDRQTLLVHFESDLLFAVDSAALTSRSRQTLGDVAQVLSDFPKTAVIIQGHTDSTGSDVHNQGLSERRAQAVATGLAELGISPVRMATQGFGETMPVATNQTAEGRRLNRRVDIMLRARAR